MREGYREYIIEENKYYDLLISNPRFKPCGCTKDFKKRIVGIAQGDPSEYRQGVDRLDFKYFNSWKDAYMQLCVE